MAMRDLFRGGRDRNREQGRGDWRDEDRYGQQPDYGRDYSSSGQSGRSDWSSDEDYGRAQPSRYGGRDYSNMSGRDYERDYPGGQPYSGGFYTGESGRAGEYGSQYGGSGYQDPYREGGYRGSQYGRSRPGEGGQYGYGSRGGGSRETGLYGSSMQQQHRGRGPRGYQRSDERIREDVCDCLTEDPQIDASNLEVTVKNGEVTLSGSIDSRGDKRRAEELIEDLSGVKDVHNNLRVATEQKTEALTQQQTPHH